MYLELTGGRTRALDLSGRGEAGSKGSVVEFPARPARPKALDSRVQNEERAAHKAFIEELGDASVWSQLSVEL